MLDRRACSFSLLAFFLGVLLCQMCSAGMPAPLPTQWTKDHTPSWASPTARNYDGSANVRWQAISFFAAGLLVCAWGVQRLWRVLRCEFQWLPPLGYGRAVSLVVLWGFVFILVLTMISGARELMTPGAWKQEGWTYKLAEAKGSPSAREDSRDRRKQALEQLRFSLWKFAATHEGRFPAREDDSISPDFWNVPDWPGLSFLYVPGLKAQTQGQLLVYEPELNGEERLVLLSNGLIGSMPSSEIRQALANPEAQ